MFERIEAVGKIDGFLWEIFCAPPVRRFIQVGSTRVRHIYGERVIGTEAVSVGDIVAAIRQADGRLRIERMEG